MTEKTTNLISELTTALFEKKAILITGNTGVGKTYIAKEIIRNMQKSEFSCFPKSSDQGVVHEIIPCHSGVAYEDFVGGIQAETLVGRMKFSYTDRILVETLKKASDSYNKKRGTRYIILLDDIQRCDISSLFGDAIALIGSDSEKNNIHLNSGVSVNIPPNFYIVATYNNIETGAIPFPTELLGKFYVKEIISDISFITEDNESDAFVFYDQIKNLFLNNLDMQFKTSLYEQFRYLPGHGFFSGNALTTKLKYQLIPLLRNYISEGILSSSASPYLHTLEESCNDKRITMERPTNRPYFANFIQGVTPDSFINENNTRSSISIEKLIGRIIEQGLLSDNIIINRILFNTKLCYRTATIDGISYTAPLVANIEQTNYFMRDSGDRSKYNGGTISIHGQDFVFTGGSHPKTYVNNPLSTRYSSGYVLGETVGANVLIIRTLWMYYHSLINELNTYLKRDPLDTNKQQLLDFYQDEWNSFVNKIDSIVPKENPFSSRSNHLEWKRFSKQAAFEANKEVRKAVGDLVILWKNPGEELRLKNGNIIILEGVDNKMSSDVYKEYKEAMETLSIKQMILQGPPGTSKTHSAKEFLKYAADNCSEEELTTMQIVDYSDKNAFCNMLKENKGQPPIAWDIVQFHPSYGYEDFIRGISVSTKKGTDTIVYDTVNKLLGNIAELATSNPNTEFYLIIDEINRANLATVFGELIYGLEYRNEDVATPYSVNNNNCINIPDNLYIIGTMNTADKSIGGIDYAIRRRFLFFEQLPDRSVIENYNLDAGEVQSGLNKKAGTLFDYVKKVFDENLNPEYRLEDVQIGHTYFLVDSEEKLLRRFEYQIIPILKEYYKDGILSINTEYEENGFAGFLNCISGRISATTQKDVIRNIFENLIA